MSLLIDGYNLLHASGILGGGLGPGGLERSRMALLNFVVEAVDSKELAHTIVVFDAANAPPGLPRTITHRGLTVRFAAQYESADELIEELIRADSSPRRLTVVSSDHRLHRAARRRHARPIDSDRWYADMLRRRQGRQPGDAPHPSKPADPATIEDVEFWLKQFAFDAPPDDEIFPPGYGEEGEKEGKRKKEKGES